MMREVNSLKEFSRSVKADMGNITKDISFMLKEISSELKRGNTIEERVRKIKESLGSVHGKLDMQSMKIGQMCELQHVVEAFALGKVSILSIPYLPRLTYSYRTEALRQQLSSVDYLTTRDTRWRGGSCSSFPMRSLQTLGIIMTATASRSTGFGSRTASTHWRENITVTTTLHSIESSPSSSQ